MRTGAIFARGSCRALKWVALFGAVFALGAGSAFAQATFTSAEWTPERDMIKLTMSADVWSRSPSDVARDFTVSWGTGADAMEAAGTVSTIPSSESGADDEFMITLDKAIPTGAGGDDGSTGITVAYDGPVGDTDVTDARINAEGILDNSAAHAASADNTGITTAENTDGAPMIEAVEAKTFRNGVEITAFQLPTAKGNQPFTYLASNLPAGLTWDADGADDTAGNADDRMISGTPSAVTDGAHMVTYTVTDRAPRSDATSITFAITVNDAPDTPEKPTATATTNMAGSLDVMWDAPKANNSPILYYEVQHKATEATDWVVPNTRVLSGTRHTFDGLTDGMSYDFQVRAINAVGMSGWSATGMGTPMASAAVPVAPAAPTVTATANTRGSLNVSWMAPDDNGSAITGYGLRYRVKNSANWTVMTAAITTTSTTLTGMPDATTYEVQVNAQNANGPSAWSASGEGTTAAAPAAPSTTLADITKIELGDAEERRIGGEERLHLDEGANSTVTVTVEWTVAQLREIYAASATPGPVNVALVALSVNDSANWLSPAEVSNQVGQDLPDNFEWVSINIPKKPAASARDRATVPGKGTMTLTLLQDDDAEDEAFRLAVGGASQGVSLEPQRSELETDIIVIDDDDPQKIVLERSSSGAIYEGDEVEFGVSADPELVNLQIDVRFDLTDADGTAVSSRAFGLSPATDSIGGGDDKIEVTIELEENDGNRDDEELTLHAEISSRNRDDIEDVSMSFTALDVHQLPWLSVSPKTGTVAEGGEFELTLTLDRNPTDTRAIDPETRRYTTEAIDVTVMADDSNVEIMPRPVKFPKHSGKASDGWTQEMTVTVMPKMNDDIDGDRDLVLNAEVAGTVAANGMGKDSYDAVSTLMVTDGTAKLVWPKSDEEIQEVIYAAKEDGMGADMMFNPGEMIEVESAGALFNHAEGVTLSYSAMSDHDHVATTSVSGAMVTVTAGDEEGMAHITITAHASPPSGAKGLPQTDPREASIIFPVEVGLEALTLMLKGPEDMNVVEGGMGAMVTVEANRAVTDDVTVMLVRDRAMSSAGDDDYTANAIVIESGMMTGSTMVMAVEDNMMETVDNMPEELVLYGMTEGMAGEVTGEVHLHLWDAAVPALPIIAQLLLAAFLAVGGYRRYRRR